MLRHMKFRFLVLNHPKNSDLLQWKKGKGKVDFPVAVFQQFLEVYETMLQDFDIVTVPAPSFHDYDNYPIWDLVKEFQKILGFNLVKLFPDRTGKTRMGWTGSLQKTVPKIKLDSGKYVLIIDDIHTTGHTLRVCCQAICDCGSFPCAIALSKYGAASI